MKYTFWYYTYVTSINGYNFINYDVIIFDSDKFDFIEFSKRNPDASLIFIKEITEEEYNYFRKTLGK